MKNKSQNQSKIKKIVLKTITFLSLGILLQVYSFPAVHAGLLQEMGSEIGKGASDVSSFLGLDQLGGGSGDLTSFTEFKGGLQAPTTAGYAPGLTKATDARMYVLNVTNFVLGFLGLTAVIVIIYGGFLYVLDQGKGENSEKGKKSVTYAIIGILIILSSYAIVNTVLQAPGGKELNGAAQEGNQATGGNIQQRFNAIASRVKTLARNLVTAYAFNFESNKDLDTVQKSINDGIDHLKYCKDSGCGDNWSDGLKEHIYYLKQGIDDAITKLQYIKNYIPDTTTDSITVKSTIDDYISYLSGYWDAALNKALAKAAEVGCDDKSLSSCDDNNRGGPENRSVFAAVLTDVEYNSKYLEDAKKAVNGNFNSTVNLTKYALKEIYDQVTPVTNIADKAIASLVDLGALKKDMTLSTHGELNDATGSLKTLDDSVTSFKPETPGGSPRNTDEPFKNLLTALKGLTVLYNILKDINFVDVHLGASTVHGNAPLIVNFSSVGSVDPSGITIQDPQIQWDLDGDGQYGKKPSPSKFRNCEESKPDGKATVSCIYTVPGTYRVKLKIDPSAQKNEATGKNFNQEIAAGISTIDIKVNPPQNKIILKINNLSPAKDGPMNVTDDRNYIIKYNKGFLSRNVESIIFPFNIAKTDGIQFDASETLSKDEDLILNQSGEGATVKWNFGDNSNDGINNTVLSTTKGNLAPPAHKYTKEGTYTVSLEIADKNQIVDRKVFSIVVSNLAPAIDLSQRSAKVGQKINFDASNSVGENGPLKYSWSFNPAIKVSDPSILKSESFSYQFDTPGTYTVDLTATDSLDKQNTAHEEVSIQSEPPVAQFKYSIEDKTQPAIVLLDGTKSFDPDGKEQLDYIWSIDGTELKKLTSAVAQVVDGKDPSRPKIKFTTRGTHKVTLQVSDPNGNGDGNPQYSDSLDQEIQLDSILDIAWGNQDSPTVMLKADPATNEMVAQASLTIASDNATTYEMDFGDGKKDNGNIAKSKTVAHQYKKIGTYIVKATVYDSSDNQNTVSRKVFVGSATSPIAIIGAKINSEEVVDTSHPIRMNRKDVVTFDAAGSKNTDGTNQNLTYSWDFGDGTFSTKAQSTHTYKELGNYTVKLKTVNANDVSQSATDSIDLNVLGQSPELQSITAIPVGSTLTTPVTVNLTAVGANDPDGQITSYRWWYFDPNNNSDERGVQVTTSPTASITIGTRGQEGEKMTYKFGVELTDNENNTVNSNDILNYNIVPTLTVTNGPNKQPIAKFSVDRTNILVGDSIEFASSSTDPDGKILHYYWDFEGDGFANNQNDEGPNVTHIFSKTAKDGIKVRLKVIDNNDSEAVSDAVTIYVDGKAKPPVPAFIYVQGTGKTVKFKNNSTSDTSAGASLKSYSWDFDLNTDSNGDGKKDNDIDSTQYLPTYEYKDFGVFRAKLTVDDSNGTTAEVINNVNVVAPAAPAPAPAPKPAAATPAPAPAPKPAAAAPAPAPAPKPAAPTPAPAPAPKPAAPTPAPAPAPKPAAPTPAPAPAPKPAAPTLDARLLTSPSPSVLDGKIHFSGDKGTVVLDFSTSTGNIKKYVIDKNVIYDSNGNGINDDDEDYVATKPGKWTTDFFKSYGYTRVRLTVYDTDGKKDTVEKEVVFDTSVQQTLKADIFGNQGSDIFALLVTIAGFGILLISVKKVKKAKSS